MGDILFFAIGIVAGVFSGLLGIGGGTVVVPALVYFFGMTQHKAQGTILAAFLPPVALLAVLRYYQTGNVDIRAAAIIAIGLLLGGYFGANLSLSLPETVVKRAFAVFLVFIAVKMFIGK